MSRYRFANRASALITATCSSTDATVQLETGAGAKLPVLTGGDLFRATMISADGTHEIVNCTAVVADVVTIVRSQEGTPASTFPSGSRFEVRLTAGMAGNFLQRTGDSMNGDIDMAGHAIERAVFSGPQTMETIHTRFLRSIATPIDTPFVNTENTIHIPPNTNPGLEERRPRYMGRPITNAQMFDGIVFQWNGDVNNPPSHLKLCDGSQDTPDMREVFVRGWSNTFAVNQRGGQPNYNTSADGAHNHHGSTDDTVLTVAQMPAHTHGMPGIAGQGGTEGDDGTLGAGNSRTTTSTGGNAGHRHGIPSQEAHTHNVNVIPPFHTLAFVMFKV